MLGRPSGHGFYPNDLAICQRVFDQVCSERKLDPSSPEVDGLAATLISLFGNGCTDEATLLELFRKAT
ncbi:hypothetical protein NKH37_23610 [Mesorhizobium sp. M1217]|uniref:hypothetical protein n=1 Tax=Mesorhizobium sp. M1217 TaxID=2957070 RepID=UPI00333DAC0B